jgi:polyisoprenoid-binding protein YceI
MRIILFLFFLSVSPFTNAQNWSLADKASTISFRIKNFGVAVDGSFSGLTGVIRFDPAKPAESSFQVSVDASSINTGIELRNKHLRKEEYLDVAVYPQLKFVSKKIAAASEKDTWIITGLLTIKKVSKEISFPFKIISGNNIYRLTGEFKINRRDFSVGGSSFSMVDMVTVLLNVQLEKTKEL